MYNLRDIRRWPLEQLLNWAMSRSVNPTAKMVLVQMVMQCDSPFLQIMFNNRNAARDLNVTVKTIRKAIRELENNDLISSRGTAPLTENDHRYLRIWKIEADE